MTTRPSPTRLLPLVLVAVPLVAIVVVVASNPGATPDDASAPHGAGTVASTPGPLSAAAAAEDTPRNGGTHTVNYTYPPATLNNILRHGARATAICREYLFPPLLDVDGDTLELVPELAESRPVMLEEGRRWRWKLREGVYWQRGRADGTPVEVTTDDVKFSWDMIFHPDVMSAGVIASLGRFRELLVVDRYTFEVTVDPPYFRAETDFGYDFALMPAHLASHDPAAFNEDPLGQEPVGYGPYRFDSWVEDQSLTLVRDRNYWDHTRRPYYIDRVRFLFVKDADKVVPMFLRGDLSLCTVDNPDLWESRKQTREFQDAATFHEYYLPRVNFVGFNHRRPLFQDVRVRTALTFLCPREAMVRDFYRGHAEVVSGPWPWGSAEYDRSIAALAYDPARARQLLDEAGWKDHDGDGVRDREGQPFRFQLNRQTGVVPAMDPCVLLYQQELRKVGIVMDITMISVNELIQLAREGDFDAFLLGWSHDPRDVDLYPMLHSSQGDGGNNYVGYSSPAMDRLLDRYRDELDPAKRAPLAREIHLQFMADQPFLLFPTPQSLVMVSTRYRDVSISRRGALFHRWWIDDE